MSNVNMNQPLTIVKNPVLPESMNYEELRQKGIEYIQELGSSFWTDYNIHDPGITILELLCYAITDLGYRTSFDIKDLLADPPKIPPQPQTQAFFTAKDILTINPWTINDFRKMLIDIDGVKNAWLNCLHCPCEMFLFADCAKNSLTYSETKHPVIINGLYDVLIEFDEEERFGDLNSGKIKYNFIFPIAAGGSSSAIIEIRLPSWHDIDGQKDKFKDFRNATGNVTEVSVNFISGNKNDNSDIPSSELSSALRRPLYVTLDIKFIPDINNISSTANLSLEDIPFTIWFKSGTDRKAIQLADIKKAIENATAGGIAAQYLAKIKKADEVLQLSWDSLQAHRNLSEDYCSVKAIQVEDIAVCADMEIESDADIEKVLAESYYKIGQYFAPDIKFYSLKELIDDNKPVDEIFEGPVLNNGFIDDKELEDTELKKTLYTSDIINLLMEIEGIISIKNFTLVRYNKEGFRVEAQSWSLDVSEHHQPRLYVEGSKILVYKNSLPFLPDASELIDTLQVFIGTNIRNKLSVNENDLPVPNGTYFELDEYYPLQYSLPFTYGVGYEGLPQNVSDQRIAQAKQLKSYLIFFEQLLMNYIKQLTHIKDLFAVSYLIKNTYFTHLFIPEEIKGIDEIYDALTTDILHAMTEDETKFLDRRNRFLDNLLARFAEQFTDYALMLYSYFDSKEIAQSTLIKDKVEFIKALPFMSSNRARSFNYKDAGRVCSSDNVAGLQTRIERILGIKKLSSYFELYEPNPGSIPLELKWQFLNDNGDILLVSSNSFTGDTLNQAELAALKEIDESTDLIINDAQFQVKQGWHEWKVNLIDSDDNVIASNKQVFEKKSDAENAKDDILAFARNKTIGEKIFIVEHLLLRPRNKPGADFPDGDPLLTICIPPDCKLCGEEDPYSFRLTIVMNGEGALSSRGILFRRFAEQTIRQEVPAHLALKICWVSSKQLGDFEKAYCEWLSELALIEPDTIKLHNKLCALMEIFEKLKSIYPPARLHDCIEGKDENPVFLGQTII